MATVFQQLHQIQQYDYNEVIIQQCDEGYAILCRTEDADDVYLVTQKNEVRHFKTIDAAAKIAQTIGHDEIHLHLKTV